MGSKGHADDDELEGARCEAGPFRVTDYMYITTDLLLVQRDALMTYANTMIDINLFSKSMYCIRNSFVKLYQFSHHRS